MGWYFLVVLFAMLLQNGSTAYVSRINLVNKRHYVKLFDHFSLLFFFLFIYFIYFFFLLLNP